MQPFFIETLCSSEFIIIISPSCILGRRWLHYDMPPKSPKSEPLYAWFCNEFSGRQHLLLMASYSGQGRSEPVPKLLWQGHVLQGLLSLGLYLLATGCLFW